MAAAKTALVGLTNDRILVTGSDPLTLESARQLVGQRVEMPTRQANETAEFTVESVSQNRETGDLTAWVVRPGLAGGHHARLVAK